MDNDTAGECVVFLLQCVVVLQRIFTCGIVKDLIIRQIRERFVHHKDHIYIFSLPVRGFRFKTSCRVFTVVIRTNCIVLRHIIRKTIRESQLIINTGNIEFIFYVISFESVFGRQRKSHYNYSQNHSQQGADYAYRPVLFHFLPRPEHSSQEKQKQNQVCRQKDQQHGNMQSIVSGCRQTFFQQKDILKSQRFIPRLDLQRVGK